MKVLIIGSGISALSAYNLALDKKDNPILLVSENEVDKIDGYQFILNKDLITKINEYDLFVISPGVYYSDERLIILKKNNKKVISEIEYAYTKLDSKPFIIGVTGSNGKTSIVEYLSFVLKNLGLNVIIGGNIGIAFSSLINKINNENIVILELSNFQLDYIESFKPNIAIITNITPNHLDKTPSYMDYINSKLNIYKNMTNNDHLIILDNLKDLVIYQGYTHHISKQHNHLETNKLFIKKVLNILNIKDEKFIDEFKGVKYRLQKINDQIYHDGKSTTPSSTLEALRFINNENVILILGGRNKNLCFKEILDFKINKIIIVYGELRSEINGNNVIKVNSLKDAVYKFNALRNDKSILLYSPGCTSFDQYNSYLERCEEFDKLIKELGYV